LFVRDWSGVTTQRLGAILGIVTKGWETLQYNYTQTATGVGPFSRFTRIRHRETIRNCF